MSDPPRPSYRAFLSYSHRDQRAAERWHRFLESFRVDPLLVGRSSRLGPIPEHLRPIFRDRLDHPASGSLDHATSDALARSDALILLATPNAAHSHWVNEEVRHFRHNFPDRPLIVVLDGPRDTAFRDCLPPALAFQLDAAGAVTSEPYTPIATDPRPGRDGLTEAQAKIVADLLGVAKQDILPRLESQMRRAARRQWAAIAAVAALALILATGLWTVTSHIAAGRRDAAAAASAAAADRTALSASIAELKTRLTSAGALTALRSYLRPRIPEIDKVSDAQLPATVQRLIDELSKPGADPADFDGAARHALEAAQSHVSKLEFADAAKVLDAELARSNAMARDRAALLAERGRVAKLQLHYREAAAFDTQAAGAVAFDPAASWRYTLAAAGALFAQGNEFGDNGALDDAIVHFRAALALAPRPQRRDDWALTQNNLGNALEKLGERESGTAHLEEALVAFRAALREWTRERVPLDWAKAENNLGFALERLGERESGTAHLEEALAAFRAALQERFRERVPLAWGATQNNLGIALRRLGERESGTAHLNEAISAFRAALQERTRERVPLAWGATQNNLGNALERLGERESGTAHLDEAVAAYRTVLQEWTRDRVPLDWAMAQNNLGVALKTLGERESGTAHLDEAIAAYRAALQERTRERVPLDWAMTQNNLGNALETLGERQSGSAHLDEAIGAYRAALHERTRERVPLDWAQTQNNLGNALERSGERDSGTAHFQEAVAAWDACLSVAETAWPPRWVQQVRTNEALALATIARRQPHVQ